LNLPSLELRRLHSDLAWCYRTVFGLTVLKFDQFSSEILPLRHVVMLSNFIKEIVHTGPELYFSQSLLLMCGTNYLFRLILDHYHHSCIVSAARTYMCIFVLAYIILECIVYHGLYVFIVLYFIGLLLVHFMPCCSVI